MRRVRPAFLAVLAGGLLARPAAASAPVVVELFTSQGCSDCPAADRLVSTWGLDEFKKGTVVPLSFDIDYWDYLGWKDLFSSPIWSERQTRYCSALGSQVYTPQMVVAGREAFVGSDESRARKAAKAYLNEPARARLAVKAAVSPRLRIDAAVESPAPDAAGLHAVLVLFENGLVTDVLRGENAGRTLRKDFAVRRLVDLGPVSPGKALRRRIEPEWDASWKKENSGAVLFLQDPKTLAVYGAAVVFPLL